MSFNILLLLCLLFDKEKKTFFCYIFHFNLTSQPNKVDKEHTGGSACEWDSKKGQTLKVNRFEKPVRVTPIIISPLWI